MARTKTNTQNDTKTRTTSWRNRHLEKLLRNTPDREYIRIPRDIVWSSKMLKTRRSMFSLIYFSVCHTTWEAKLVQA